MSEGRSPILHTDSALVTIDRNATQGHVLGLGSAAGLKGVAKEFEPGMEPSVRRSTCTAAVWCLFGLLVLLGGAGTGLADDPRAQRALVNGGTISIMSGDLDGTDARVAADLANALDDWYDLRVLPIVGKGSVRNLEDLLFMSGIDIAIVHVDVLEFYKKEELIPSIDSRIRYITKLFDEEIHVLAKAEHDSMADLAGRTVNFGTESSGAFLTSGIIFDALGLDVEVMTYPDSIALAKLRAGEIDAMVFVGGKPVALATQARHEDRLHLLPLPQDRIDGVYVPSSLTAACYPELVPSDAPVPTLAVGAVMVTYNWPHGHPRAPRIDRFVDRLITNFDRLLTPPFHPKWQEVDLQEELPGWERLVSANDMVRDGQ